MIATARRATLDDIPILVELMREFYAEANYALDEQWASTSFSTLLRDYSLGAAWVMLLNSEPVGYVVLTTRYSMEYGGLVGFIDDLFISPPQRRQGLGREALRSLFDECKRRGLLAVHVEVGQSNEAAQALYCSYGLEPYVDDRQMLSVRLSDAPSDA